MDFSPQRIVCLTAETVDTLYRLGQQDRIVGITGFATNPPQARREKPRIAAYTNAKIDRILALKPDLVLLYSDLQAELAQQLIRQGCAVYVFNQRSIQGILQMIDTLGRLTDSQAHAQQLIQELRTGLLPAAPARPRPKVYFEEWMEPLICGIHWVSELIELAGGDDIFAQQSRGQSATERIINDPQQVVEAQPDIIIGSWCGRRFRPEQLRQRPGWQPIPAVQQDHIYEIKSALLLQPGPTALSTGFQQLCELIQAWQATRLQPAH